MSHISPDPICGEQICRPLVSILVPSFNHEQYILNCLNSICRLDYPRLELIVSDDRSSDRTYELARQWTEDHAGRFEKSTVIRQPVNLGIVKSLQFLFHQACGEYLVYLGSDDELVESAVSVRVQILEERGDIDAIFGDAQLISTTGLVMRARFIPRPVARELLSQRLLVSSLLLNWFVPGPVMLMRKRAIAPQGSLGTLPADLMAEDRYIYLKLASERKLMFLDAVVARYRTVENSMSRAPSATRFITEHILKSDTRIKPMLRGFDRMAVQARIARNSLELQNHPNFYLVRKTFWRATLLGLKILLRVRSHLPG